jgi:osomolarity two-component system sensor histidine kinase NIK1
MVSHEASTALASVLSTLGTRLFTAENSSTSSAFGSNGAAPQPVKLPGEDFAGKAALEKEVALLSARIQILEARASATNGQTLPDTPNEVPMEMLSLNESTSIPANSENIKTKDPSLPPKDIDALLGGSLQLSVQQMDTIRQHVENQSDQIQSQRSTIETISAQLQSHQEQTSRAVSGLAVGAEDITALKRELLKHQQTNLGFSKALREIGNIITAVANGDLTKPVVIHDVELDPEIATFKRTINVMIEQLKEFALQVTRVAKETGTEGQLGGKAVLPGVSGVWAELTENVNVMSAQLTEQVRDIAKVTTAVARGDLTQKVSASCKGEILDLKV